jgi:dTDP-4-amino-4,6-dideoxygalactose transaminase
MMTIPFLDLRTPHVALEEDLVGVFRRALRRGAFIGGEMLDEFERAFAAYCGTAYAVGVGSGTDALRFALIASGVRRGQTVVTVPNTFIATAEAITQAGARVDFVDIDPQTFNLDPARLEEFIHRKCYVEPANGKLIHAGSGSVVTTIVPVHLYGQPADMDPIFDLATRYRLTVIEDACQAHGAEYFSSHQDRWRRVGSMGRAAAFSFYPGKNLGACGEAGAVTTNDGVIATKVRMLRDHGQARKYYHQMEGYNGRLDAIQAGILRTKLEHLHEWNERRRDLAARYNELLECADGEITLPTEPGWARSVYHLYVVRVASREKLKKHLADGGVGTGIHYPVPIHLQGAYESLGYGVESFPVAEKAAEQVLSLPIYPEMTSELQSHVAERIMEFVTQPKARAHSV